ncbi:MAG: hypothetical protein FJ286_14510 [Planctomycetes bacterium]|nr:hypothetical protein [Planctomycetota bacterium]
MTSSRAIKTWLVATTVLVGLLSGPSARAIPIDGGVEGPTPDVFYNFYVPPVPAGGYPGVGAQLYVSPRPVPPRVGHTWITYPPFMPHEFLYKHRRRYIRPAGVTGMRTDVHAFWY